MPDWAQMFCDTLAGSETFCDAVRRRLGQQAAERAGLNLEEGFFLVPEAPSAIRFDEQGTGHLATDLAGPDAFGVPVALAWRCAKLPGLPVRPEKVAENCGLEIWWETFPAEELRTRYSAPGKPPWPISRDFVFAPSAFPFTVEWRRFPWPSVWLELETAGDPGPEEIERVLLAARETWNLQARERGAIHDLTASHPLGPGRWEVYVDFGSAGPNALVALLDALREAPFEVRRVVVRGAPAR